MHLRRFDRPGSALIFALGFMVVVLIIAFGVHLVVTNQLRASAALRERVAAEYLAQAGVAQAIAWFRSQGYLLPQPSALTATVPVNLAANSAAVVLPSNHPDSYTDVSGQLRSGVVTSYNSSLISQSLGGGTYTTVASLISQSPEAWELLATAHHGAGWSQVGAVLYRQYDPLFADALFGRDAIGFVGNAYTDSYDSSKGAYGGANKYRNGDIRSNGGITLSGNATVNGDAFPGPNNSASLTGNASVTGTTTPAHTSKALPPVVLPSGATTLGAISLTGHQTQTLNPGTYVATSLSIGGNAQLMINNASGPVSLYVTGAIAVGGNGIGSLSGNPQNFVVVQSGGANVTLSGNAAFYGALYAPTSALTISGNGDLYGAFVGASVSLNGNAGVHYDQALRAIPGPPGLLKLVAQWTVPG